MARERATEAFIRDRLRLAPVPLLPEIRLYMAHPGSGLGRFVAAHGRATAAPYWAYPWAGGAALARHILDNPSLVAGRRVLDIGSGSGLVAIAAARAGADHVTAADIDHAAMVAQRLNASANGVELSLVQDDLTAAPPPPVDLVLAGDVFYDPLVAQRILPFLEACHDAGIAVLIGDPRRAPLPKDRLVLVAEHVVMDVGAKAGAAVPSGVFALADR